MKKTCFFVSDLHGRIELYDILINQIKDKQPDAVFIGGDLVPAGTVYSIKNSNNNDGFVKEYLIPLFSELKSEMKDNYPDLFIILGNDDPKLIENDFFEYDNKGLYKYASQKIIEWEDFKIIGYSYVPPTPFLLKDWEKFDDSEAICPGCVNPADGFVTTMISEKEKSTTIKTDLAALVKDMDLSKTIFLFHSPPYDTGLDRAALDEVMIDNKKVDVHVGSKAIRQLIEEKQPLITLHGHIHESCRLTGRWKEIIKSTWAYSAANDEDGLAIVEFNPYEPESAVRVIIK